jgi:biopolymer transport protein ExbD
MPGLAPVKPGVLDDSCQGKKETSMGMSVPQGGGDDEAIAEPNVVPLIDVLLVLLIMFIITIPVQTHAVKLDMPQNQPNQPPPTEQPKINRVEVDFEGKILWNGSPVDLATLEGYFQRASREVPEPETHLRPDKYAQYDVVAKVMAAAQRSGIRKMGFVGNEAYMN